MRELKVRAWVPCLKKIVYGNQVRLFHNKDGITCNLKEISLLDDGNCRKYIEQIIDEASKEDKE